MPFEKCIKKLGLQEDEVVYTTESVLAFPRNFIYDMENPDSVFYFGCISNNKEDFENYFENPYTRKFAASHKILIDLGGSADTILIERMDDKMKKFSYKDSAKNFKLTEGVRYFVVCYWSAETLDRHILKNYRHFFWYVEKSTLDVRIIFVCTDDVN